MYNTLKEIQESLSFEDLCKYAKEIIDKNADEVVEVFKKDNIEISIEAANECVDYLKGINIVEDEELDNVAGGTCYGSDVIDPRSGNRDRTPRPYVVVTCGNSCPGWKSGPGYAILPGQTCTTCKHHFWSGAREYCATRWDGHEHFNNETKEFEDGPYNGW